MPRVCIASNEEIIPLLISVYNIPERQLDR